MSPEPFDLAEYTRTAHGSHRDAIGDGTAFAGLAAEPGGADALTLVALLRDLEGGTMPYLRRVLVTPTHKDARVTAFLVTWSFEKFWVADALTQVLRATRADVSNGADVSDDTADRPDPRLRRARSGPVPRALRALVAGPDLVAAHLVSLAVSDAATRAAYRRLTGEASGSPALAALATRLEAVDARQGEFLRTEAAARLAASPRAQRLAARELDREAYPLGMADRPAADRARFARLVFPGGAAEASEALADIAALPGLADAVARTASRTAEASAAVSP
ncbi:hypothetical protein ET445_09020 [Agromyces protaetiae]|uniref:Uncharacterized protein n=1 Tax=Agromyces protaetiae TaxID=2509455 RepID=A0A4P6FSE4_9MICO|nr:hypothetical protein [Agromyces protaetiae]QAY73458.1 hypothetical protein ET445_09020 [Agromyces protaetiae]